MTDLHTFFDKPHRTVWLHRTIHEGRTTWDVTIFGEFGTHVNGSGDTPDEAMAKAESRIPDPEIAKAARVEKLREELAQLSQVAA